ncbi:MAG: hypothetical protein ACI4IJ_03395 [Acutalibacteraceae bacterium]
MEYLTILVVTLVLIDLIHNDSNKKKLTALSPKNAVNFYCYFSFGDQPSTQCVFACEQCHLLCLIIMDTLMFVNSYAAIFPDMRRKINIVKMLDIGVGKWYNL